MKRALHKNINEISCCLLYEKHSVIRSMVPMWAINLDTTNVNEVKFDKELRQFGASGLIFKPPNGFAGRLWNYPKRS